MSYLATASLVERLLPIERDYFLFLNNHRSAFWDTFMVAYSDKLTWLPLALLLLAILLYKVEKKEIILFIICGVLIGLLCDYFSANLIKPYFERLRPSHHPDFRDVVNVVLERRGGRYGFISNHAANGFGIAIFTSLLFRYRYLTIAVYSWVIVTSYSRIYLGVHFITDILGGIIWGTVAGLLVYWFFVYSRRRILHIPDDQLRDPVLSHHKAHLLILGIFLTIVYITIRAFFFPLY